MPIERVGVVGRSVTVPVVLIVSASVPRSIVSAVSETSPAAMFVVVASRDSIALPAVSSAPVPTSMLIGAPPSFRVRTVAVSVRSLLPLSK